MTKPTNIDWEPKDEFYLERIMAEFRHDIELEASGVKPDVNVFLTYKEQFMGLISSLLSSQKSDLIQKVEEWAKGDLQSFYYPQTGKWIRVEDLLSFLKQL